jgi:protein gp37
VEVPDTSAYDSNWHKKKAARMCLTFLGSLMDWAEGRDDRDEPRKRMWQTVRECEHLHFQMLTKRRENILRYLPDDWGDGYPNVWIGTTIEDNRVASRANYLREVPAVVRFVSYEPAIGPLDQLNLDGIDWVIYGGESGPGHRAEDKQWARDMRSRCVERDIAFFHKQSAGYRTELGIELDGEIVREFPVPRCLAVT